jgi:hypothetical protein
MFRRNAKFVRRSYKINCLQSQKRIEKGTRLFRNQELENRREKTLTIKDDLHNEEQEMSEKELDQGE